MRGIATNVSVYQTFAAERSESEPGQREIVCIRWNVEGSGVPQMCPMPGAVRALLHTPKFARIRAKRTNAGEAGMVR